MTKSVIVTPEIKMINVYTGDIVGSGGNAQPNEVMQGKTFTNDDGQRVGTYIPPIITGGNAKPNEVLEGRTFTNDDGEQIGTYVPSGGGGGDIVLLCWTVPINTNDITLDLSEMESRNTIYGYVDLTLYDFPSDILNYDTVVSYIGTCGIYDHLLGVKIYMPSYYFNYYGSGSGGYYSPDWTKQLGVEISWYLDEEDNNKPYMQITVGSSDTDLSLHFDGTPTTDVFSDMHIGLFYYGPKPVEED